MCFTSLRVTLERSRNAKLECAFCRFGNAGSHFCDKATSSAGDSGATDRVRFAAADYANARVGAFGSDGATGKRRCGGDDRGRAGQHRSFVYGSAQCSDTRRLGRTRHVLGRPAHGLR